MRLSFAIIPMFVALAGCSGDDAPTGQVLATVNGTEITSGEFAKEFIADYKAGAPKFNSLRAAGKAHPIEKTGSELRAMMPWISAGKQKVEDAAGGSN